MSGKGWMIWKVVILFKEFRFVFREVYIKLYID